MAEGPSTTSPPGGDSAAAPEASPFAPLRHPVFRAIWLASMASNFGSMIQSVGASWLMTSLATRADMVALVQSSVTLPIMLFALLAGAAADTFDRRRMMLMAQSFMLVVSAGLAAAAYAGLITPWVLLLFTFLIGCGASFHGPAWQASVGEMVPRADLPGAVTLNSMGFNIARSLGPAVGGAIVAAVGAAAAFALNAVSYLGLLFVLRGWHPERPARTLPRETIGGAMAAGLRYARWSPQVQAVLVRALLFGAGASAVSALMPLVARDLIGGGPATYGLLLGAFGVGAVGGAVGSSRLRHRLTPERMVFASCLVFAAAASGIGLSRTIAFTLLLLPLAGASWVLALSTFNVTVQLSSPKWVVGRALALYQMAAFGGMAAGAWAWGTLAEAQGLAAAHLAAAAVLVSCGLLGLRAPLPEAALLEPGQTRTWSPPQLALDMENRSGAVVVTIDFRIQPQDEAEFLAIMAERRRIRKRDGARRWTLLRDLGQPLVWIERFHAPNWVEYIRQNNRLTEADILIVGRVRELHQGPEPPRIRRMVESEVEPPQPDEPMIEPYTDPRRFS